MADLIQKQKSNPTLQSLFDGFFDKDWFHDWQPLKRIQLSAPAVNIKESDKAFSVELAAPGLKKEDFKIQIENEIITISAEKKEEKEEKGEKYTRKEYNYNSFSRSFTLPEHVYGDRIAATYSDGVLKLIVPKKENNGATPARKEIPVN